MVKKSPILATVLLVLTASAAAAGCSRHVVAGSAAYLPVQGGFNEALLDRSILAEANYQRCLKNRPPLRPLSQLRLPAERHSNWMARSDTLSHTSAIAGRATLRDRINSTGLPVRSAAENIAQVPLFDLTPRFRVVDAGRCRFAAPDGRNLGPHSYSSLARKVVDLWMHSPGHRRNLLSRSTNYMAAAASLSPDSQFCGEIYITQIFAG